MLNAKFTKVIAILIVVLEITAIVLTFVGAIMGGETGKGLLFTGMFCFVAIAVLGYVMITFYNRVHRDDTVYEEPKQASDETANHTEEVTDEGDTK